MSCIYSSIVVDTTKDVEKFGFFAPLDVLTDRPTRAQPGTDIHDPV